jgi:apolipoprotein N-acyltransferase
VTRAGRAALVAGYVAATFLAFPQPIGGRVLDLGPAAGFVAPMLLLLALRGLAPRAAAGVAFLACWLAHAAVLHWIYVVTVVYGHAPPVVGVIAPVTLALYPGLCGAAFGFALRAWDVRGGAAPFAAAALWTALYDHARTFVLTGFPWALLGYAQHANPALTPLAAITGVHGLSFVSALGGAGLAALVTGERRAALIAALFVAFAHVLGLAVGAAQAPASGETVRVAVLQGNIDQGVKWSESWRERTLGIYERLTREAAGRGAELIVWPETAVPGAIEADSLVSSRVRALARETRAWLVVGSVGVDWTEGARPRAFYDSAFLLNPEGEFVARYDKSHLVPFGEYVPLRDLLGLFLRSVARGISPDDVTPGPGPRSVTVAPGGGDAFPVGVAVCYELIFPDLVRRFPADGAELLLGITNDAWYGRTGAPYQFLAITAMRSAETGLWTARAANTGVSAFIDSAGRVQEQTPIFETGLLVADVPRHEDPRRATFYVRHGDLFAWACWLAAVVGVGTAWRRRRG